MIVTRVKLVNWRNFQTVDVRLGPRVFIAGPNASGKSNFLDVFRFLRDIAQAGGGLQKAIGERGGLSKIRCLSARRQPQVEIEVHLADSPSEHSAWTYAIGVRQETRGRRQPFLTYERVAKNGEVILERPESKDREDALRLTQTHLEQINANIRFRDIVKHFESTQYLHLVPQLFRHADAYTGPGVPGDPYGRSFLERLVRTPEKTRRNRLGKIEQALKAAVPSFGKLSDVKDEMGVPHLEALYHHWQPNAGKQREDQFSDGTLRLIGLLWALLEGDSLLLLEEPELSLHSSIVRKLPGIMHRVLRDKKRQIILSTHSADLLSDLGIGGEEVLLLRPSEGGTSAEAALNVAEIRSLLENGFSVADAALPRTAPRDVDRLWDL